MQRYKFSLVLSGVSELDPELANALYEATDGDVELEMREGSAFVEFDREALTLRDAVTVAIQQVEEGAGSGIRVVQVESEDANAIATINARLASAAGL